MNSETKLNNKIVDLKNFAEMKKKIDKVDTLKIDKNKFINDFFKNIYSVLLEKKHQNLSAKEFQIVVNKVLDSNYK